MLLRRVAENTADWEEYSLNTPSKCPKLGLFGRDTFVPSTTLTTFFISVSFASIGRIRTNTSTDEEEDEDDDILNFYNKKPVTPPQIVKIFSI